MLPTGSLPLGAVSLRPGRRIENHACADTGAHRQTVATGASSANQRVDRLGRTGSDENGAAGSEGLRRAELLQTNGFNMSSPVASKSLRFLVTRQRLCVRAVAAMKLSLTGIALPPERRCARSSAQRSPVCESQARQWIRRIPSSNQRLSLLRRRPVSRRRIPYRISPKITGSTASSRSFVWSQSTTLFEGSGFIASLNTLASTRYFKSRLGLENRSTLTLREQSSLSLDNREANRPVPDSGVAQ